jgi:hypothetical protein
MEEIWKDIKGYEGLYQISNLGNIKKLRFINNITNKEKVFDIKPQLINSGYYKVVLYKNGKYKNKTIHRLVAEAFIPNPTNKPVVNHKDGNKKNNNVENLEWCTYSQNNKHAYKNNLMKPFAKGKFGSNNPKAKKVNMLDKKTNKLIKTFGSLIEAANYLNIDKSCHIVSCCKGRLKTAYGYKWEYTK